MLIWKSLSLHACTKYKEETLHFTYLQVEIVSDSGLNGLICTQLHISCQYPGRSAQAPTTVMRCCAIAISVNITLQFQGMLAVLKLHGKIFAFFWWLQYHIIWFEWVWEMTKAGNLASWRFYGGDVCSSIAFTLLHRLLFKLFYTCHHFVTFVGRMSLKTLMEKDRSLLQKEEEPLMRYNYIFRVGVINNWTMECWLG